MNAAGTPEASAPSATSPDVSPAPWERRWTIGVVGAYLLIRAFLEHRYILFDPDEGLEMLAAGSLREGKLPYLGALSHRGPFLTLLYGIPCSLFGPHSYRAVHAFCLLLFVALAVWFQRSVARATNGRVGAFALLSLLLLGTLRIPSEDTWGLNSDFLMGGLATAAVCVLFASRFGARSAGHGKRAYATVGILLALAFLTKQNGAPYAFAPAAFIVFFDRDRAFSKLGALAAGFAAPLAVAVLAYVATGELARAWYFFYQYNRDYAAAAFTRTAGATVLEYASWLGRCYGELFALAFAGAALALSSAKERPRHAGAWFLASAWALAGLGATVGPGKTWDNYLWAFHAPVALLAGLGADAVDTSARRFHSALGRAAGYLCFAIPILGCLEQLDRGRATLASRLEVGGIPPPRVSRLELLDDIARTSVDGDSIYVTGYAPEMYILAARRPASRHVVSNFIESVYPGRFEPPSHIVPRFLDELRYDLDRNRPRVILDACALGFICHPSSALTRVLPSLLGDYHPLPGAPAGVYVRDD